MKGDISKFTGMLDPFPPKYITGEHAVIGGAAKPSARRPRFKAAYVRNSDLDIHADRLFPGSRLRIDPASHVALGASNVSMMQVCDLGVDARDVNRLIFGGGSFAQIADADVVGRLEREVRQLRETTERMFNRFDARIESLEHLGAIETTEISRTERMAAAEDRLASTSQEDTNLLTDILNDVADHDLSAPALLDAARDAIGNSDANLRSASARALAIVATDEAKAILADALASEKNKVTARVIRSALRSLGA